MLLTAELDTSDLYSRKCQAYKKAAIKIAPEIKAPVAAFVVRLGGGLSPRF